MAKEFKVTLGGESLTLRYKLEDREAVEELFPNGDGTPGDLISLVARHLERSGSVKVQIGLLWAGLRHLGNDWTVARVAELVQKFIEDGGDFNVDIVRVVYRAILAQGAIGRVIDTDAGKAPSPAVPPTSEVAATS